MTESEWLCANSTDLLRYARFRGLANDRKLRLYAVACCQIIDAYITEPPCRVAVETAERFADGAASAEALHHAHRAARESNRQVTHQRESKLAASPCWAAAGAAAPAAMRAAMEAFDGASTAIQQISKGRLGADDGTVVDNHFGAGSGPDVAAARMGEALRAVGRHVLGNPFRPYPAPRSWPADAGRLAEALYAGGDVAFALADALLEAGHAELAEHFRGAAWHPKGCWVVDVITARK